MEDKKNNNKLFVLLLLGLVIIGGLTVISYSNKIKLVKPHSVNQNVKKNRLLKNGISSYGRLSVQDNFMVNEKGKIIQLRGFSTHGVTWYPRYTNAASMRTIREYGGNVFRLALYSENVSDNPNYWNEIMDYAYLTIENALNEDMYIIVDWHVLSEETPIKNQDKAIEIFTEISSHYGNEKGIIYEICNEPNGDTTWNEIKEYADTVIPVIRENAPDSIIIVGTPKYSTGLIDAFNDRLGWTNILYAYHTYVDATVNDSYDLSYLEKVVEAKMPVFISEWGIENTDTPDEELYGDGSCQLLEFLKDNKISWCYWSLSNKAETHSAIKSECNKYSDWVYEDMTFGGKIAFDALGKE